MDLGLKNKHVLVTGASGGIGNEITNFFLSEGANVTAHFFTNKKTLETLLKEHPSTFSMFSADLRIEIEVKNLFIHANKQFGRVDSLVANAGVWPENETPIHNMSFNQWENTLKTNLSNVFLCIKYFCRNLVQYPGNYGSIIVIGSSAGVFGEAGHVDYSSSKAALKGLMLTVKNEIVHLAPKGRINLVNPGWTITPMVKDSLKDKSIVKRVLQTIPMRKVATTQDIANVVVFLTSDKASGHISGQIITVAGGMEGRMLFEKKDIEI
ncbi:MAG: 3-oxoacyl-[acyl-carrier-protein] reductase FabG [Candidatus Heimdallarchaeota archaeon LC_3]|nr:MAG: 3-oxoacyl-[acyl-carrier-protein] reductase FabG [Candidatus Heimdallarchaeota archaeon LC_3]OLS19135.1 MAG: 3-oxoacyl-[acyl-carrier-protein] reductase FabG [Candidatus Heimdallarchaeota archaeon LC_3]